MKGWYSVGKQRKWHLFERNPANETVFITVCCRPPIIIDGRYADRLKKREDLPPNALLCRACTANPKAAE